MPRYSSSLSAQAIPELDWGALAHGVSGPWSVTSNIISFSGAPGLARGYSASGYIHVLSMTLQRSFCVRAWLGMGCWGCMQAHACVSTYRV